MLLFEVLPEEDLDQFWEDALGELFLDYFFEVSQRLHEDALWGNFVVLELFIDVEWFIPAL